MILFYYFILIQTMLISDEKTKLVNLPEEMFKWYYLDIYYFVLLFYIEIGFMYESWFPIPILF